MLGALEGHTQVMRTLLNRGANVSIVTNQGFTALHIAGHEGHLAATKLLMKAGADLEAAICTGHTPLHLVRRKGTRKYRQCW